MEGMGGAEQPGPTHSPRRSRRRRPGRAWGGLRALDLPRNEHRGILTGWRRKCIEHWNSESSPAIFTYRRGRCALHFAISKSLPLSTAKKSVRIARADQFRPSEIRIVSLGRRFQIIQRCKSRASTARPAMKAIPATTDVLRASRT